MNHRTLPRPLWIAGTAHEVTDTPTAPHACSHSYTLLVGTEWRHVCDDLWMAPALPAWPVAS